MNENIASQPAPEPQPVDHERRLYRPDATIGAYRMPTRFGMGSILIITGIYAFLFASFSWMGATPMIQVFVALFPVVVALAQIVLFRGRQPRLASIVAGVGYLVTGGFMSLGLAILSALRMMRAGYPGDLFSLLLYLFCLVFLAPPFGALLGYLVGGCVSGVFLCIDHVELWLARRRSATNVPTPPPAAS